MLNWDLLLTDANLATMAADGPAYGAIQDGALAIAGGKIAWVGAASDLPEANITETRSLAGSLDYTGAD